MADIERAVPNGSKEERPVSPKTAPQDSSSAGVKVPGETHDDRDKDDSNSSGSAENSTSNPNQFRDGTGVDQIRTVSRVPGNPNYYEKDGLRTYGDGEDHDHEPKVRI